ncbi:MAG: hypothetical protein HQ518_22300, partial [Rhodopirellula sp.]|nr:hypothetical protein [Rhodopirellula sp.]
MPIKFRCQHCRQFLGISRAKAGEIFDCPTCGWTLRVPDLDGTIRPLPGPGLDLEDSKLAQALDELASIDDPARVSAFRSAAQSVGGTGIEGRLIDDRNGDESESSNLESRDAASTPDGRNNDSGLPLQRGAGLYTLDQPIELPPLPAPVPIDMQPRVRAPKLPLPVADDDSGDDSESGRARAWKSTAQAGDSWRRLLAAAEIDLSEGDSTDEPVKEADSNSASSLSDAASAANSSS